MRGRGMFFCKHSKRGKYKQNKERKVGGGLRKTLKSWYRSLIETVHNIYWSIMGDCLFIHSFILLVSTPLVGLAWLGFSDQIGLLLKSLWDIFYYKFSLNVGQLFVPFKKPLLLRKDCFWLLFWQLSWTLGFFLFQHLITLVGMVDF